MERNLYLLGATAIEDQLQTDVDKTLSILMRAGIKIWMLTGDKIDTAKSIAFSCKLISHEFNLIEIPEKSRTSEIIQLLNDGLLKCKLFASDESDGNKEKIGLIISTDELSKITSDNKGVLKDLVSYIY
jgi:phospholipid-translocating ATPase